MCCSVWPCGGASVSGLGLTLSFFMGTDMEKQLVRRFKNTFDKTPSWAWDFMPPIPLIGKQYKPGKGLLIYASAENLSWLNAVPTPRRFQKEHAWNRYRACYEEQDRKSDAFFPNVGIQPMTDGGLFAAALFLAEKTGLPTRKTPRAFLETVAISNWCKFSIEAEGNRDYIADVKKLTESLPFVIGELALLQPKIVLVPKQIWRHPILKAAMRGASPCSCFLPVPQFNSRVVNIHLQKYDRPAAKLKRQHQNTPLALWMKKLSRINKDHAWRYLAMLDE